MQPPVSQNFKIKRLAQAVLRIFRPEGQKEVLICFFIKKRLQKNLEKTIKKEQSCHENHIGDLQFQQPAKGFINIPRRGQSAECEENRHIKKQTENPHFIRNIKLPRPKNSMNKNYRQSCQTLRVINV